MGDAQTQRLLNPWMLHLQKLGLELKCPLCLQLFNRPLLLPCNHIFCTLCTPKAGQLGSECPACKHQYVDREVKTVPFMENIVTIYRNIDATFNANLFHPVCSDVSTKCPASLKVDYNKNSMKENVEIAQEGNSSNGQSMTLQTARPTLLNPSAEGLAARSFDKCVTPESGQKQEFMMSVDDKPTLSNSMGQVVAEKQMEMGLDGFGFIQLEQLSPPLSGDSKDSDPGSSHRNAERHSMKRPVQDDDHGKILESNIRCKSGAKCQTVEHKRQKKTNEQLNDTGLEINGHPQTNALTSGNAARTGCNLETKFGRPVLGGQDLKRSSCAFCHSSNQTEGSGPLLSYAQGKEVTGTVANFSKVTHVHEKCIDWTPQIFFKDGVIKNLESEVARASKLKCSSCGKKGAGLGCYVSSCQKTYHVPCAYDIFECRWDCDDFLLLCPNHASRKFPSEQKLKAGKQGTVRRIATHLNPCKTTLNAGKHLVLCGSALSTAEKYSLVEFARSNGATVSKYWRPEVTHVIAATNSEGACTRTLKVLMAILNGKWILRVEWVKACVEAGRLLDEEPYEVCLDTHGCSGGPKAGRLRFLNNAPKLFKNLKFYFVGDFLEAFKTDLLHLVTTAGGTIMDTMDGLLSSSAAADAGELTLVVYNADLTKQSQFEDAESLKFQRLAAAEDIAQESGSEIVGHTWILESIAACSLLPFTSRA